MALFRMWVIGIAVYRVVIGSTPDPSIMGLIALIALVVNMTAACLLFRDGDSNKQSIWRCSRNVAIGNVAVMLVTAGVFASASRWPDLLVATIIAALNLSAALHINRLARSGLRPSVDKCEPNSPLSAQFHVR